MTYAKNPDRYPEEFAALIRRAVTQELRLPCSSPKDAARLRGRLYGYIGALKKAVEEGDCPPEWREIYQLSHKVQFRCEPHGLEVIAQPLDMDQDAKLLRSILNNPEPDPQPQKRQILVPMNPDHLPPGLRELAIKRAESAQK